MLTGEELTVFSRWRNKPYFHHLHLLLLSLVLPLLALPQVLEVDTLMGEHSRVSAHSMDGNIGIVQY